MIHQGERVVAVLDLPVSLGAFGDLDLWKIVPDFGLEAADAIEAVVQGDLSHGDGSGEPAARERLTEIVARLRAGQRVKDDSEDVPA